MKLFYGLVLAVILILGDRDSHGSDALKQSQAEIKAEGTTGARSRKIKTLHIKNRVTNSRSSIIWNLCRLENLQSSSNSRLLWE